LTVEPFKIKINDSSLTHRFTPWDADTLKKTVNEITQVTIDNELDLQAVLGEYEEFCVKHSVDVSIVRASYHSRSLRKALVNNNFELAEISHRIVKNLYMEEFLPFEKDGFIVSQSPPDKEELKSLASRIFSHGRFSEDLKVSPDRAHARYGNWVQDLLNDNNVSSLFLYKEKKLIGFMFYSTIEVTASLLLGGMDPSFSHLAAKFWSHVFHVLKEGDIFYVNTVISAANVGVINLYSFFNFSFKECLMGYHKHYQNEES